MKNFLLMLTLAGVLAFIGNARKADSENTGDGSPYTTTPTAIECESDSMVNSPSFSTVQRRGGRMAVGSRGSSGQLCLG